MTTSAFFTTPNLTFLQFQHFVYLNRMNERVLSQKSIFARRQGVPDLPGDLGQPGHVLIATFDGAGFEVAPELCDLRVGRVGRHAVFDVFLTLEDAATQVLLEALKFGLHETLGLKFKLSDCFD